jgi:hypothetical protein
MSIGLALFWCVTAALQVWALVAGLKLWPLRAIVLVVSIFQLAQFLKGRPIC